MPTSETTARPIRNLAREILPSCQTHRRAGTMSWQCHPCPCRASHAHSLPTLTSFEKIHRHPLISHFRSLRLLIVLSRHGERSIFRSHLRSKRVPVPTGWSRTIVKTLGTSTSQTWHRFDRTSIHIVITSPTLVNERENPVGQTGITIGSCCRIGIAYPHQ